MTPALPRPLYIDIETFSPIPIAYGAHRYAEEADIMLFAYAYDDEPVKVWDCTDKSEMPPRLLKWLDDPKTPIVIHNSSFDRTVLKAAWNWDLPTERIVDTMVRARTLGLPGSLSTLCEILAVPVDQTKDKKGKELIQLFCKPLNAKSILRRATRETHPAKWKEFIEYARLDIEAMRAIHLKLASWNHGDRESALWQLDQKINDRGMRVDTELAAAAIRAIGDTKRTLDDSTCAATDGAVISATQRDELLGFILRQYDVALPDMQAATLERRMEDPELPGSLKELLAFRLQTCTTSTAKYKTLINCVNSDGRLRGTMEFCGAGRTGRWAGRKFQVTNLPSRNLAPQADIDRCITLLKLDCADLAYDNLMKVISSCIRGCIIASEGKKLVVSDLKNIEGTVAAWLADETWKIEAFRIYFKGLGEDTYRLSYGRAFNIAPGDVNELQRQIGKVMELMLQYEGGVGAFLTGAATYDIDLDAMAEAAWDSIPADVLKAAQAVWDDKKNDERKLFFEPGSQTFGLKEKTYVVCDSLKRMWRLAHPAITSYWKHLATTVRAAIQNPGGWVPCGKVKIRKAGSWLQIMLPSGRSLCYAAPKVEKNGQITYMGLHQYTRKWTRIGTYGGKLFENMCQGVARDVMAENMPMIEESGYGILFTCHDEVVTETPDNDGYSTDAMSGILSIPPPWARDLPLAAKGYESQRYRK